MEKAILSTAQLREFRPLATPPFPGRLNLCLSSTHFHNQTLSQQGSHHLLLSHNKGAAMSLLVQRLLVLILGLTVTCQTPAYAKEGRKMIQMKLTSPEFIHGKPIPDKYSCNGEDTNPPLAIEGVPAEAKSLALIMDDPDAPAGIWMHWVIWNIDPATTEIKQGSVPKGAQEGQNSWKKKGYGGPCPPSGTHRYFFRLYALKEQLNLPASATRKDLDHAMQGKIIAESELMGVYSHK
jgi:Raf kinase inhibitor-like YbhB/YbcL family protein